MKFAESVEHRAIYLDIQVGKFLPTGIADPTTVYWMGIPSNPSGFAIHEYQNQISLELTDDIKFNSRNKVVSGEEIDVSFYFNFSLIL